MCGSVFPSLRGKTVSFDEAISGVLFHEIATQSTAARNDDLMSTHQ
ncbi:MAG: hypothetical protein RCG16_05355 [Rickettsia hoogstraalii]